jgi:hypothetical protein
MEWSNKDPREVESSCGIVILRPSLNGGKISGTGFVDSHHGYYVQTSFEDYRIINVDEIWNPLWFWIKDNKS